MSRSLICHFLIGLPASGKSTLARKLWEMIPDAVIVSTDTARHKLYGNESIQGDWINEVEPEVLRQIAEAIALNKPVIYDATNVRRDWRMGMLMKIEEKLKNIDAPQVYWIAWYLQTPIDVCKEWNQKRDRQVPNKVIEEYSDYLGKEEPSRSEIFFEIYSVTISNSASSYTIATNTKHKREVCDLRKFEIDSLERRIRNAELRLSKGYTFHRYSSQLDFNRLMHLISLIFKYPGIGQLSTISPNTISIIFGESLQFNSALDEITAIMHKSKGSIYANRELLKRDIKWINSNLIQTTLDELQKPLQNIKQERPLNYVAGKNHSHTDLPAFSRLVKVLGYIIHSDAMPISPKSVEKAENLRHFLQNNETQKPRLKKSLRDRTSKLIKAIVVEMLDNNILEKTDSIRTNQIPNTDEGKYVDNVIRYYAQINDIDFPCLKQYEIKSDITMNEGYYFGTGLFSRDELNDIYELLQSQSEKQYLSSELDYLTYQRFKQRLENGNLTKERHSYPVKAIGSKSIVDFDEDQTTNRNTFKELEEAIRDSQLIEIDIPRQPWGDQSIGKIKIYPLQILFHNQAWYLGYETFETEAKNKSALKEDDKKGLFKFERIDRIKNIEVLQNRDKNSQISAFKKLNFLYQSSAGIHLGNSVGEQKAYLNPETRKSVEETFKIYATDFAFNFLSETAKRFPKKQMEMSLPRWLKNTEYDNKIYKDKIKETLYPHSYEIKITLPKWSIDDIYLMKWLVPWGKEVKVVQPKQLADKIKGRGNGIQQIYSNLNFIVCEWDTVMYYEADVDAYISIKSNNIAQHSIIVSKSESKNNLLEINLNNVNDKIEIGNSIDLVKRIQNKRKARKYISVLIYCSVNKKITNRFASELYQAVSTDRRFENTDISLHSASSHLESNNED